MGTFEKAIVVLCTFALLVLSACAIYRDFGSGHVVKCDCTCRCPAPKPQPKPGIGDSSFNGEMRMELVPSEFGSLIIPRFSKRPGVGEGLGP